MNLVESKNNKYIYLSILIVILLISDCSVYSYKYRMILNIIFICSILPISILGFIKNNKRVIYLSIMIVCFLLSYFVYFDTKYLYKMFNLIIRWILVIGLVNYCKNKKIDILDFLIKVIVCMAIINLILYLIINVINIPINYKILNFSGIPLQKSYLYIFFTGPKLIMFNRILTRIQGVFWEPGLYQIFLNLALLSYLFQEKKHKKKIIFILIVSIILTYSTTGYILGIVLIFIKLLAMIRDMKNNKILKFLLITFMPIITLICIYFALKIMILKINAGINYGNKSYSIRTTDLIDCAKQFLKTPIIGSGFFNYSVLPRKGSVNGLFSIFYQTGIIGTFILLVIPMKRLFGKFKKEICLEFAIGFILWLIMSLMNEPIQYSNFILMIISYGYLFNYEKYNKNKFF